MGVLQAATEGFQCIIMLRSGSLIIDIHEFADLLVIHIIEISQVNNLSLPRA